MTTLKVLEEFKNKKQELKDWLYGTVYKGYDQEEEAEVVQQDVEDHFTDEWFTNLITQDRQHVAQVLCDLLEGLSPRRSVTDFESTAMNLENHGARKAMEQAQALIRQTFDPTSSNER